MHEGQHVSVTRDTRKFHARRGALQKPWPTYQPFKGPPPEEQRRRPYEKHVVTTTILQS